MSPEAAELSSRRMTTLTPLYPEGKSFPHAPIIDGVRRPLGATLVLSTSLPYRREVRALHANYRMGELPDEYQVPEARSLLERIRENRDYLTMWALFG